MRKERQADRESDNSFLALTRSYSDTAMNRYVGKVP